MLTIPKWGGRMMPMKDYDKRASRAYTERQRQQVFDHYGWACACCGTLKRPSIDHIDGNGRQHRLALGIRSAAQMYTWLIKQGFPEGYQTHCLPCNQSKQQTGACRLEHRPDGTYLTTWQLREKAGRAQLCSRN